MGGSRVVGVAASTDAARPVETRTKDKSSSRSAAVAFKTASNIRRRAARRVFSQGRNRAAPVTPSCIPLVLRAFALPYRHRQQPGCTASPSRCRRHLRRLHELRASMMKLLLLISAASAWSLGVPKGLPKLNNRALQSTQQRPLEVARRRRRARRSRRPRSRAAPSPRMASWRRSRRAPSSRSGTSSTSATTSTTRRP